MLLIAENIQKTYSDKILLDHITLSIDQKDKIGIVGANGCGKSTLLKIISGKLESETGEVTLIGETKVSYLPQELDLDEDAYPLEWIMKDSNKKNQEYQEHEVKALLTKLELFDYHRKIALLSGGEKKKVALTKALVTPSDMLILDEPTNHLDSDIILWLEKYLIKYTGAILMVTHDRYFLDRITNKIIELNKGRLTTYEANYSKYLSLKASIVEQELSKERKLQALIRKEYEWISRGAMARTSKDKKRIEKYENLISQKKVVEKKLVMESAKTRLGKKTIELVKVGKSYQEEIFKDFSFLLDREDRVGIIGKNGSGKTTLLKIIVGEEIPDCGEVIIGETVKIGYFSQNNEKLDDNVKAIDYIKDIAEMVKTKKGYITASQMLENFLFENPHSYIGNLSGGEKRRLSLLGILMSAPNVLLLDEPTNDLDITTLTILEDYLEAFSGAIIVVSHDRYFLDRVVNRVFVLKEDKIFYQYLGGYSDYLNNVKEEEKKEEKKSFSPRESKKEIPKLTYNEQKELDTIEDHITELEYQMKDIDELIQASGNDYSKTKELYIQRELVEKTLNDKLERWAYLTDIKEKSKRKS
ncbi:MAG TPA: ABC-F family ATP-binding cassette domain-containing protein [Bacilli bacterium]|nr:ABC-F family ATP-binding cassette domain-containing protein [Bacilli bacterium]HOH61400.1 ABC-F family ATP-binding cassette domain-containing protein [Bacilli bacterium]HPY54713.1 ABC-F family ATP-binding cassette domain-containing protein [Bacilli bacterium]HQB95849.1 ABC-F family ATP-binding cassette domain-containing protein [Bacilli bacterium]HQN99807.1 ABC-F family ATP-binding cassette domain-containing protein [Bacilli bacterium]